MANPEAGLDYIQIAAGVTPTTDDTSFLTPNWTFSDGIRFRKGLPEKRGGFKKVLFDSGRAIKGVPRSTWSTEINGKTYTLIGTESRLYALIGSTPTNITPFDSNAIAAHASLSTTYDTLANNPISTVINTNIVTVQDASATRFQINDVITLSGATATGGISIGNLNTTHVIRSVSAGSYTFYAATNASSTASGGGNSVIRKSGLMRCTVSNTLSEGDRIAITGAADSGGILAAAINLEFIIRNVTAAHFDFMTASTATSSVTAAGGNSTAFNPPIAAGLVDEAYGFGYGVGKYGVGLYGVAISSASARKYPRIWYFDRFGDFMMITPGNGGGLYEWNGDITNAPVPTTNAPTAINFMFVSDNSVVCFGKNGTENRITASDVGNRQTWSGTAQNQFFDATQAGAGRFIGVIKLTGVNLIFTENQVYTFRYIGLPNVWEIKHLSNVGMISSLAGQEINGIAYWMGVENFYYWGGGNIDVMPSASVPYSTILKYVFDNINLSQKSKCFSWFDKSFQEFKVHYPSAGSNEPDRVACVNITEGVWWPDTINRVSAERPAALLNNHRLCDVSGNMYQHENGTDADTSAMPWTLTTNLRTLGKKETKLSAFTPNNILTAGTINVNIQSFQAPDSTTHRSTKNYTVKIGDGRHQFDQEGRFWQYTISGNALGQFWRMGKWSEEKQQAGDGK